MSKASNALLSQLQQYLTQNMQSTLQAGETENPYLASLGQDANSYEKYLRAGDYTTQLAGHKLNMTPLAMQEREAQLNNAPLGSGTFGRSMQQPSGAYQLNNLDRQDKFAGASAAARQANVDQNAQANLGQLFGLGEQEQNRRTGAARNVQNLLGTYFTGINQRKPSFLHSLIMGGIQAAPGLLAAI